MPTNKPNTRGDRASVDSEQPAWAKSLMDGITKLDEKIVALDDRFTNLLKPIQAENISLRTDLTSLSDKVSDLTNIVKRQQGEIAYLRSSTTANRSRLIRMECYSMRENIIISGLSDPGNDEDEQTLRNTVCDLFSSTMHVDMTDVVIARCHRLRKSAKRSGPRDVIVRFSTQLGKSAVMKCASNLRGHHIYINDQYPREINSIRGCLRLIMKRGKDIGKRCSLVQDKLRIDGKMYTINDIADIPFTTHDLATKSVDTHVLFSGRLSPFSNFYTRDHLFSLAGVVYCSSEQYYHHQKALHGGMYAIAAEIMDTRDPVTIKHTGDKLPNSAEWSEISSTVMETGVEAKFSQNQDLRNLLIETGTKDLQECNKFDSFWGTGLSLVEASQRSDHSLVEGKNTMGKILASVRDIIQ